MWSKVGHVRAYFTMVLVLMRLLLASVVSDIVVSDTEKSLEALRVCPCGCPEGWASGPWQEGDGGWVKPCRASGCAAQQQPSHHSCRLNIFALLLSRAGPALPMSEVTHFASTLHDLPRDSLRTQIRDFLPNWGWRKLHNSSSSASLSVMLSNIFKSSVQASKKTLEARLKPLIIRFPCNSAYRFLTSLIVSFKKKKKSSTGKLLL